MGKFLPFEVGLTFFDLRTKGKIGSGVPDMEGIWGAIKGPSSLLLNFSFCFLLRG